MLRQSRTTYITFIKTIRLGVEVVVVDGLKDRENSRKTLVMRVAYLYSLQYVT